MNPSLEQIQKLFEIDKLTETKRIHVSAASSLSSAPVLEPKSKPTDVLKTCQNLVSSDLFPLCAKDQSYWRTPTCFTCAYCRHTNDTPLLPVMVVIAMDKESVTGIHRVCSLTCKSMFGEVCASFINPYDYKMVNTVSNALLYGVTDPILHLYPYTYLDRYSTSKECMSFKEYSASFQYPKTVPKNEYQMRILRAKVVIEKSIEPVYSQDPDELPFFDHEHISDLKDEPQSKPSAPVVQVKTDATNMEHFYSMTDDPIHLQCSHHPFLVPEKK